MTVPAVLNRRHKAALFFTLLAAGMSLMLPSVSGKQAAGIILVGLAFAWAFGSNRRIVHWLLVSLGFALLVFTLHFRIDAIVDVEHIKRGEVPTGGEQVVAVLSGPPNLWVAELFWHYAWPTLVPGILLLGAGIGLVIGVRPRKAKPALQDL